MTTRRSGLLSSLASQSELGSSQRIYKSGAERYIQFMSELLQNRITIDPAICNGKPTIRGLRITVQTVLEYLGAGESQEEILRQFPMLEPGDIAACLAHRAPVGPVNK